MDKNLQTLDKYRRQNMAVVCICATGVIFNMLLSAIVTAFGLPLYLDTVGSVAVAALGGYLPGVIVGFATNLIKSVMDPSAVYYGVLNVLIALAAAWLSRRGWMKRAAGIAGMILVFTMIGGGLGAVIPWYMEELAFDSESLSGVLYGTGFFNLGMAHIISSILMDLPDKVITVILAVAILRLIPARYQKYVSFTWWLQTPISEEEADSQDRLPIRVMSLQRKMLLVLGAALTTVALVAIATSYVIYQRTIIREHMRIAKGTAEIASGSLNGDMVDGYLENGEDAAGYDEAKQVLANILGSSTDIAYIYVYKIEEDGFRVVFDIDTESAQADPVGSVIPFDEGITSYLPDLMAGKEVGPMITNDEYGYMLTAYQPVYSSDGRCVCYVGVDVDMGRLKAMERSFLVEMVSLFLGFFIMLCVFVIWLTKYHIILPVGCTNFSLVDVFRIQYIEKTLSKSLYIVHSHYLTKDLLVHPSGQYDYRVRG